MCRYILVVCYLAVCRFAYNYMNDVAKSDRHFIQYKKHNNTMYSIYLLISPSLIMQSIGGPLKSYDGFM